LRRRREERVLHLRNPLPKMMKMRPPTQTRRILATTAAAAAMLKKVPNMKKIL
jgi:hypothetical protein